MELLWIPSNWVGRNKECVWISCKIYSSKWEVTVAIKRIPKRNLLHYICDFVVQSVLKSHGHFKKLIRGERLTLNFSHYNWPSDAVEYDTGKTES